MSKKFDVIVVGGGHNGLAAALRCARSDLKVLVVEEKSTIGGACKTEKPFKKAPDQLASTGAYLLGLMPPEIPAQLGIGEELFPKLERRNPYYFLPTLDTRYLLFTDDEKKTLSQIESFFSTEDARAYVALHKELGNLRDDIAETWLEPPLSIEETADKYVRPELSQVFIDLCRGSVFDYLSRFEFKSDLLLAMFAVTDGLSGLAGDIHMPGTGFNFLVHNMCRLPDSKGTWMRVKGGMGAVTHVMGSALLNAGAEIKTGSAVSKLIVQGQKIRGVALKDGTELFAETVIVNADPFRMLTMLDVADVPTDYRARIEKYRTPGATLKLNLCMKGLPKFTCYPESIGACEGTVHIIADTENPLAMLSKSFNEADSGRLPELPAIEWYFDTNLTDGDGNFSSALFVPGMPYDLKGTSWDKEVASYSEHLLDICERFAPGTKSLVTDMFPLAPPALQEHFGITMGHIHHVPNTFALDERLPYRTPIAGLYSASAGCHPAGSVIGGAGFICGGEVVKDLGNGRSIKNSDNQMASGGTW